MVTSKPAHGEAEGDALASELFHCWVRHCRSPSETTWRPRRPSGSSPLREVPTENERLSWIFNKPMVLMMGFFVTLSTLRYIGLKSQEKYNRRVAQTN